MTDQTGERLARSACPKCDSLDMHMALGHGLVCVDCLAYATTEAAYAHGLKLEREKDD